MVKKIQLEKDESFAPQLHVLYQSGNISNLFSTFNYFIYFIFYQNTKH